MKLLTILILFGFAAFISCNLEPPTWDFIVHAPLGDDTLHFEDLLENEDIQADANGNMFMQVQDTFTFSQLELSPNITIERKELSFVPVDIEDPNSVQYKVPFNVLYTNPIPEDSILNAFNFETEFDFPAYNEFDHLVLEEGLLELTLTNRLPVSLGFRQLTVFLFDSETSNQIARFEDTRLIESGTSLSLGTISLDDSRITKTVHVRVIGGCYGSREVPVSIDENSALVLNLYITDLVARSGKARIPSNSKNWNVTYKLNSELADIDSFYALSGMINSTWDWNIPVTGTAKITFLNSQCKGEELTITLADVTKHLVQVPIDSCLISCNNSHISFDVEYQSPGSGVNKVSFGDSSNVEIVMEITDLEAEWIAGQLNDYSVSFQDTVDLPENTEGYTDIPLNAFEFSLEIDNPYQMGGSAVMNVFGDAPTPIILNCDFGSGTTLKQYNQDNSGLLTILSQWPEDIKLDGIANIGNTSNSLKWYTNKELKVFWDLLMPLSFKTNTRYYLDTPIAGLDLNEDIIDTSEANFQSVALLALVTSNIPAEVTVNIHLARDSLEVIDHPAWVSETIELEPGTMRNPSKADWRIHFNTDDFYLFNQGKLFYYAEVGFSTLHNSEWKVNRNQFVKVNTHIEATIRRDN